MSQTATMIHRVENEKQLVLERVFDAPRDLVFKMFKEADHLKRWWGPRGWELPVCKVDFRPGGVWHYCMKCVDPDQGQFFGMESWGKAIYKRRKETVERSFADAKQLHGHRYARFRSLIRVACQCLMAAAAQNIKKIAIALTKAPKPSLA